MRRESLILLITSLDTVSPWKSGTIPQSFESPAVWTWPLPMDALVVVPRITST